MEGKLTASEALYGFVGWLTTQPGVIKMGAGENCVPVCDAVGIFCKANKLADPRDGWNKSLIHPGGYCEVPEYASTGKHDPTPAPDMRWVETEEI